MTSSDWMEKDFYKVLGVAKDAPASQHHGSAHQWTVDTNSPKMDVSLSCCVIKELQ